MACLAFCGLLSVLSCESLSDLIRNHRFGNFVFIYLLLKFLGVCIFVLIKRSEFGTVKLGYEFEYLNIYERYLINI